MDGVDLLGGRYRLVERLGEGGMSVVWRANDEVLRREVAVKLLSPRFMADWASRQRIRAEAQAVAQLSHPNVAGVYDYGESERDDLERVPYVVMELLVGPSLSHVLAAGVPPVRTGLRICAEVAAALAAAHEQGIVHRDVKPANVVLTPTGAKVVDFGVAAAIGDLSEGHPDAVMYGTPAYIAPERLDGGPVVAATDVYGLGLLLYRVLTGEMPWSAETTTQMLHAHMYVEPGPLPPLPQVPRRVLAVCRACLAKDPAERPTAAEVAAVLAQSAGLAVRTGESGGSPDDEETERQKRVPAGRLPAAIPLGRAAAGIPGRRGSRLAVAGALAISLALAAVAVSLWRTDSPTGSPSPAAAGPVDGALVGTGTVPGQPVSASGSGSGTAGAGTVQGGAADQPDFGEDPTPVGSPSASTLAGSASGPAGSPSPGSQGGPGRTPTGNQAEFSNAGGSVVAQCVDREASLVSWAPADGYVVTGVRPGPIVGRVGARFKSTTLTPSPIDLVIRCVGGFPVEVV